MELVFISEGFRIFAHSVTVKLDSWKKYEGSVKEICDSIISDCFESDHFCASAGHFHQFFTRDFGIAVEQLVKKHRKECVKTLNYALEKFFRKKRVSVAITPGGTLFDFPCFSPDSLAFLLRAIRIVDDKEMIRKYSYFLEQQIDKWCKKVLDKDGFVKKKKHFGGMRDHAIRSSSAYDNTMVLLLKQEARKLGLHTPEISLTVKRFTDDFFTGEYIKDGRDSNVKSGDACIVPLWLGLIKSKKIALSCLNSLRNSDMDKPVPLAYSQSKEALPKMIWQNIFSKDWESEDTRWLQLGLMYCAVAKRYDKKIYKESIEKIKEFILRDKNILEVYTVYGKPFRRLFYHADEGMLWGAALVKEFS